MMSSCVNNMVFEPTMISMIAIFVTNKINASQFLHSNCLAERVIILHRQDFLPAHISTHHCSTFHG